MIAAIKRRRDFEQIYSNHDRYPGRNFVVLVRRAPGDISRAGIVVGRKVGNAVLRNTVKRRVRALIRELPEYRELRRDFLVIARPPAASSAWVSLREELSLLMRHALTSGSR